ncbi:MAG: hypothetical protein AAFR76_03565 [Planctomycetota bacterium]
MDQKLAEITARLTADLEAWLASPSGSSAKIAELSSQVEALKATLSGDALKAMKKGLREAEQGVKTERQKAAAEAVSEALRAIGIRLEPGTPLKRVRKKKASAKRPEGAADQSAESAS